MALRFIRNKSINPSGKDRVTNTIRMLDPSKSKLKCHPNSIRNLVNLNKLYLCDCEFESLPDSICGLKMLKKLYFLGKKNINPSEEHWVISTFKRA